jgi:hypothetical protein
MGITHGGEVRIVYKRIKAKVQRKRSSYLKSIKIKTPQRDLKRLSN